jgi:hypothetical protein
MPTALDALRDPEGFIEHHAHTATAPVFVALASTAAAGVGLYGAAMHAWESAPTMLQNAGATVLADGLAWTATVPPLIILGSLAGSRVPPRTRLLATLVTVSFGGLAMLASIPVLWFIELCAPWGVVRLLANLVIFGGVGMCMVDVHLRVMGRLEAGLFRHLAWLVLIGTLGFEFLVMMDVWQLG